ncbi:MAG: peptidylprolyl isomerase [Anaerolineales bacterium]
MKRFIYLMAMSIASLLFLSACSTQTPTPPVVLNPTILLDTPTPAATCSVVTTDPTPTPGPNSYFPPAGPTDFSFGPADAPVTLIEYCDFQSPGCRSFSIAIATLMQNRDDVRFVFRPFPLIDVLDKSDKAIVAALAADKQGKFWVMYDLLFVKYDEWVKLQPSEFNNWVINQAASAGMDKDQLTAAINAPETTTKMMSMYDAAKKLNIPAVPITLINGGLQQSYVLDYQSINDTVGLIALGKKQFSSCPAYTVDAKKQYTATIHTEKGDIIIQLFPDKAPLAVNSFIFLAQQGWFNGVTFHRVIPGFVAQSGDPSGTGKGNPGYFFNNELSDLKFDIPGRVGMANSGPDTNGSQFFITFAPAPHLNDGYTIFGQVISGLEVAEQLTPRDTSQNENLPPGDKILSVDIEEK